MKKVFLKKNEQREIERETKKKKETTEREMDEEPWEDRGMMTTNNNSMYTVERKTNAHARHVQTHERQWYSSSKVMG